MIKAHCKFSNKQRESQHAHMANKNRWSSLRRFSRSKMLQHPFMGATNLGPPSWPRLRGITNKLALHAISPGP